MADDGKSGRMKAAIKELMGVLSRMESEPLRTYLVEDAVMELPFAPEGLPRRTEGVQAIVDAMSVMPNMFSSFHMTPMAMYVSPGSDSVIVEAESSGRRVEGTRYANRYVILFRFRDDRIALWREYFDPMRLGDADAPARPAAAE